MAGPGSPANNDQTEEVEQEEVDPQQAEMNKFLRETCKARLDITTPLTWQPVDDIRYDTNPLNYFLLNCYQLSKCQALKISKTSKTWFYKSLPQYR